MSRAEIDDLLRHSRENNERHGITGILLYVNGSFMQILEGTRAQIEALYEKIMVDLRHSRITLIIQEAIPHRFFGDWTMGLAMLSSEELAQILEGSSADGREDVLASIDEGRAKKLLRAFAEGRWHPAITSSAGSTTA